jgi:hypothetical protein
VTTPIDPPPLEPEDAPGGCTWYPAELCQRDGWWTPPTLADIPPEWPAWRMPTWYADRTGSVRVPGPPGLPGTQQYLFGGWLPWQSGADRYDAAAQWPDAERLTVADMLADLYPPAPAPEEPPAPAAAEEAPAELDVPPLTTPTLGRLAKPEGN